MPMNMKKVLAGGLAAGLVLNVIDFLTFYMTGERMRAEANAFKEGLGDQMMAGGAGQIIGYVLMDFVIGFILVWLYAAIRPRFGPGVGTAVRAALVVWVLGLLFFMAQVQIGLMSAGSYAMYAAVALVNVLLAAIVGGRIYTEENAAV